MTTPANQSWDPEAFLKKITPRSPSDSLDHRIESLLASAPQTRPSHSRRFRLWQFAALCAACLGGAVITNAIYRSQQARNNTPVVVQYVITPNQPFDVFDWTRYPNMNAPLSILKKREGESRNT